MVQAIDHLSKILDEAVEEIFMKKFLGKVYRNGFS
jgi:hypothetical protein